ncbi:MAG: hypothetical protein F9K30_17545 [Dechloromonas sp.]|nr:MAG: hypothetical protein F9K30_17545 [Dechloromonas sp.]
MERKAPRINRLFTYPSALSPMKSLLQTFVLLVLPAVAFASEPAAVGMPTGSSSDGWQYTDIRRIPASEARQGVASDGTFLYAIGTHVLGKYRADTGERVAGWEGPEHGAIVHLNAGIVYQGRLYCAHSNYPGVPMVSSVEIWDTANMKHAGSHSFGRTDGSLTWLDRRNGRWIACFVHYGEKGGEPGRGPEWTHLVEFDDEWRQTGGWVLPTQLVAKLGARGYSCSGGAVGPGGHLYVTGHDETELYVIDFPAAGPEMKWVATVPISAEGQAFCFDPHQTDILYTVLKRTNEIIVGRVRHPGARRREQD